MAIENQIDSLDAVAAPRTCEDERKDAFGNGAGQTSGTARTSRIGGVANRSRGHDPIHPCPFKGHEQCPRRSMKARGPADATAHVLQR